MMGFLTSIVLIYSIWRAVINGVESSNINKKYGNYPPPETPNYAHRMWGWIVIGFVAAMSSGIFSGGIGECIGRWC